MSERQAMVAAFQKRKMTATEYAQLDVSHQPMELLDGELIIMPSPSPKHQNVNLQTVQLLLRLKPNGQIFYAPIDLYLDDLNIPQPDIVWVAAGGRCQISETRLEGPPELIVEIFSPGTERRDRKEKFELVQAHRVSEYWMIHPIEQYVQVYVLRGSEYHYLGLFAPGETFVSPALGDVTVDVSMIFNEQGF